MKAKEPKNKKEIDLDKLPLDTKVTLHMSLYQLYFIKAKATVTGFLFGIIVGIVLMIARL